MKGLRDFKAPHAVIIFFVLFAASLVFYSFFYYDKIRISSKFSEDQFNKHGANLKQSLRKASMPDNRVIVTILEREWAKLGSLFDIFLQGFKVGNGTQQFLNHIIVFTLDDPTYEYCKSIHPHCYDLATHKWDSIWRPLRNHNQPKLGWRNVDILGEILELGYNPLFTETDVLWLRNPFSHIKPTADIVAARENLQSSGSDLGFFFVKSNRRTIEVFKYWKLSSIQYPYTSYKSVFEIIKEDRYAEEIELRISYLDTHFFNSFCESSGYSTMICTLHAQCYGNSERKVEILKEIVDLMRNSSVSS